VPPVSRHLRYRIFNSLLVCIDSQKILSSSYPISAEASENHGGAPTPPAWRHSP